MIDIFGPDTLRLLRLLDEVRHLSAEDVEAVARAWRRSEPEDRARAWARIHQSATATERIAILNGALLARWNAISRPQPAGRRSQALGSAAWDAGGAVVAAGQHGDMPAYLTLVAPMASRLTWLKHRPPVPSRSPAHGRPSVTGVWSGPISTPGGGR
jgi:hypothetical protein